MAGKKDSWDEIGEAMYAPQAGPPKKDEWDLIRAEQDKPKTPEIHDDQVQGFTDQMSVWGTSSEEEQINAYAKKLYPDMPLEQSRKKFAKINGEWVHSDSEGKLQRLFPKNWYDPRNLGTVVGEMPLPTAGTLGGAAAGAAAGSVAGPVGSVVGGIAGGMLGAYGGELGRQASGDVSLGEASTYDTEGLNHERAIIEAIVGGLVEGGGRLIPKNILGKLRASDITPERIAKAKEIYASGKKYGVPVTPGEATGSQELITKQKVVQGAPDTATEMGEYVTKRNEAVEGSLDQFGREITGKRGGDALSVADEATDAAIKAERAAENQRSLMADTYYASADKSTANVEVKDLADGLDELATKVKGDEIGQVKTIRQALERKTSAQEQKEFLKNAAKGDGQLIQSHPLPDGSEVAAVRKPNGQIEYYTTAKDPNSPQVREAMEALKFEHGPGKVEELPKTVLDTSVQGLEAGKKHLDRIIGYTEQSGKKMSPRMVAEAKRLRSEIIERLKKAEPDYATAAAEFEKGSKKYVEPMKEALAPFFKSGSRSDARLADKLLDPNTRTPRVIERARRLMSRQKGGKVAWDKVVRQVFDDWTQDALKLAEKGDVANPAGKIAKALAGSQKKIANLKAALPPSKRKAVDQYVDLMRAVARSHDANSDTAFKQMAIDNFGTDFQKWMSSAASWLRIGEYGKKIDNASMKRGLQKFSELIRRGDEDALKELQKLRGDPMYKKAMWLLSRAGAQTGASEPAQEVFDPKE